MRQFPLRNPGMFGSERGTSLVELMVVVSLAGLLLATTANFSVGWLDREDVRSASHQTREALQVARVQAISRNRKCRFTIDTSTRVIRVIDLVDPSDNSDDIILSSLILSSSVNFSRPDFGPAITLPLLGGTVFKATFESDGAVDSEGGGNIALAGGGRSNRISLRDAGGIKIDRWNGSAWESGT